MLADPDWECPSQLTHLCVGWLGDSPGTRWGLPGGSSPLTLHVCLPLGVEILVKGVAYTALGMGDCALAPRPVRRPVSYSAVVVTSHAFPLPVCGLVDPS